MEKKDFRASAAHWATKCNSLSIRCTIPIIFTSSNFKWFRFCMFQLFISIENRQAKARERTMKWNGKKRTIEKWEFTANIIVIRHCPIKFRIVRRKKAIAKTILWPYTYIDCRLPKRFYYCYCVSSNFPRSMDGVQCIIWWNRQLPFLKVFLYPSFASEMNNAHIHRLIIPGDRLILFVCWFTNDSTNGIDRFRVERCRSAVFLCFPFSLFVHVQKKKQRK